VTVTSAAVNPGDTITAGSANRIGFNVSPVTAIAGQAITPALTVQVLDPFNNLVISDTSSITVALGANPNGGTLSGTFSVNAVGGVATFGNLALDKAGAGYTPVASSVSLGNALSGSFAITPAAANHLTVSQQPSNAVAGVAISPGLTVQLLDPFNNLTSATASVTIALGANPGGGGALAGTLTRAAINGVATSAISTSTRSAPVTRFLHRPPALPVRRPARSRSPRRPPASSPSCSSRPAPSRGQSISPVITVRVQDPFGNLVASDASSITVSLGANPGSVTLSGTLSVNASGGGASFGKSRPRQGRCRLHADCQRRRARQRRFEPLRHHAGGAASPGHHGRRSAE